MAGADRVGQQLGNYRLLRLLGRGGFAEVYLGEHVYLKSYAALKVLHTVLRDEEQAGFLKEAQTLVRLTHPHIVRLFDFAIQDGTPFLVMEYAPNETLRQRHPAGSRLPLDAIIPYVQQVASALHYAHDQHLIHRDLKPENMLLNTRDEVLLSDFGLALLVPPSHPYSTHEVARQVAGTSAYLAPEQLQGQPRPASDQYALGIVVYEWLCGTLPFFGTPIEIAAQHLSMPPRPLREFVPDLAPAIEAVVLQALEKEPQKRFNDVQDFAAALKQVYQDNVMHPGIPDFSSQHESTPAQQPEDMLESIQQPQPLWKMPAFFTSFIGREHEVAAIRGLLQSSEVRLLTLLGPGGIGKTRLSLQVATEMRNFFPDGVCFIPLAAISDPELVIPTIAKELDVREVGEQTTSERLKLALRDKNLLLVLDNFEQIAAAAPQIEELLVACLTLKLLVTSRGVLHVQGEQEFPVSSLALPNLAQLPEDESLVQFAAVALFVQRARAVLPSFRIDSTNARTIAEICVSLDGLPLAIELAAARTKLLPPRALLARLSQRLQVLTGGSRTLPERQQTLRSTCKWSYDLLDAREQRLFRRLAVFVRGWTLEAVEAVCYYDSDNEQKFALEEVASLLDKSLLHRVEKDGEEARLLMLLTIREYGLECLAASGELEAARRAHGLYYLALAEEADKEREGSPQAVWLARLESGHENLRAALNWFLEGRDAESALRLSGALWWFWSLRGYSIEGLSWLNRALASSEGVPTWVRAKALRGAGMLALNLDNYVSSEAMLKESLELHREIGDKHGMAAAIHSLGLIAWWREEYADACALGEEMLALSREITDKGGMADALLILSHIAFAQGEYARACAQAEESLTLFRNLDDTWGRAYASIQLARVVFAQGDMARARLLVEECLAISRALGYKRGLAEAHSQSGLYALHLGDAVLARSLLEESLATFREVGDRRNEAKSLFHLAKVMAFQGDGMAAHAFYKESLTIARELNYKDLVASCLEGVAEVVLAQGQPARATSILGAAEGLREAIGAHILPIFRATYDRTIAAARNQLGEKAFTAAWEQGRKMAVEQTPGMLEEAQEAEVPTAEARQTLAVKSPSPPRYPDNLTAREVEVLRLIAQGLTDHQIAEYLVVSSRTVNSHLTSIYRKIQVSSRSSATRYAIDHHLVQGL